jgi:ribosomal-protein-alanine N-acetyltransferase
MSVVGLLVRVGSAADLVGVVALERGVAEAPHWGEAEYAVTVGSKEGADADVRDFVQRRLVVAEVEGRLVGFAVGKVVGVGRDSVGELESVVVEGAARRGGVGRALCEAVVEWVRVQGAAAMELEVRAGSTGAIALYSGLGFVAVGRRRAYYSAVDERGQREDALLMRLELA